MSDINNINKLSLLIVASITALLPVFFIKKYIDSNQSLFLFLTILCYFVLMLLYIDIFSKTEISNSYTFLQVMQILIVVFVGIAFYHESLNTQKILGVFFAIISTYLLL